MNNLHAYFALKNEQAFAKALDASRAHGQPSTPSSSAGKRSLAMTAGIVDVNTRDWLGRTVLHLACSVPESHALSYVRLLLAHPGINVNVQDVESRWTPLHRALYVGNIAVCQLLLRRSDIDTQLRDHEGLTAFDLYNTTVDDTRPLKSASVSPGRDPLNQENIAADLFTWGANRNAALGHNDSKDRTYPDYVSIQRHGGANNRNKFTPVQVKAVSMAKLHTTVITDETCLNLRLCGFGSGGRLGTTHHTQYSLLPIPQIPHSVTAVAPAQDHTLALTSHGEVWSWGLGRFSQLGYVVESVGLGVRVEEPIQQLPKRVVGVLKKEEVVGVAACKTASGCWTKTEVFTWGTNSGQLGYDSAAQAIQILPRKVTGVMGVVGIALTDTAMACLLETGDVICFRDDGRFRVKFSTPDVSELQPYAPPLPSKIPIVKITACDGLFGALSLRGDVWTFSVPGAPAGIVDGDKERERIVVKPQRVWAAKRSIDPARDIALGSDGDVIICTQYGHVFVRSRASANANTTKNAMGIAAGTTPATTKGKFHRVPFIHRAVVVCANAAGAFGALRLNYIPKPVKVEGNVLKEDMRCVQPWRRVEEDLEYEPIIRQDDDDDKHDTTSLSTSSARRLIALLDQDKKSRKADGRGIFAVGAGELAHGADMFVQAGMDIPVHRLILAARSSVLKGIFDARGGTLREGNITLTYNASNKGKTKTLPRLVISGLQPLAVLLLLEFLYSDAVSVLDTLTFTEATRVRREVSLLAVLIGVGDALSIGASGIHVPMPTLGRDMWTAYKSNASPNDTPATSSTRTDVFLELEDHRIACHSLILRARCLFFRQFFDEVAWTVNRWTPDGMIIVDLKHMKWRPFAYAAEWMYNEEKLNLFDDLGDIDSVQDLLDLIFDVMAVASELLLDRLMLICSDAVLQHITLTNVIPILAHATYLHALPLVASLQDYITCNLEGIMDTRLLDRDHEADALVTALGIFVRARQADGAPVVRAGLIIDEALRKHADWLEQQDIPGPIVRSQRSLKERDSPRLSPSARHASGTFHVSPLITAGPTGGDDIFVMEDVSGAGAAIPPLNINQPGTTPPETYTVPKLAWKAKGSQEQSKVDMKIIMAETAASALSNELFSTSPNTSSPIRWTQKASQRERRQVSQAPVAPTSTPPRPPGASPWNLPARQASTAASPISVSVQRPQSIQTQIRGGNSPQIAVAVAARVSPATPSSVLQQAANPSLGPVFSPTLVPRRVHPDGPAWTSAPAAPKPEPTPTTGLSFAAIQQQQRDQEQQPKEKRTLREIQEEERAKREEEAFMRWWAAEEQRLKAELDASLPVDPGSGPSDKRERGGRQGRRRGRAPKGRIDLYS